MLTIEHIVASVTPKTRGFGNNKMEPVHWVYSKEGEIKKKSVTKSVTKRHPSPPPGDSSHPPTFSDDNWSSPVTRKGLVTSHTPRRASLSKQLKLPPGGLAGGSRESTSKAAEDCCCFSAVAVRQMVRACLRFFFPPVLCNYTPSQCLDTLSIS